MVPSQDTAFPLYSDPIVPDAVYNLDLAGQMDAFPGGAISGGGYFASDPAGISTVSINPALNPNPTGGWQQTAKDILGLAAGAFQVFEKGSPSVATPPGKKPTGTTGTPQKDGTTKPFFNADGIGPVKWVYVGVIGVGLLGLVVIAKVA